MFKYSTLPFYLLLSLLLHGIGLCFFITFYSLPTPKQFGTNKTRVLVAYFAPAKPAEKSTSEKTEDKKPIKTIPKTICHTIPTTQQRLSLKKRATKSIAKAVNKTQTASLPAHPRDTIGTPIPALLQQLHDAIAAKEVYPAAAKMLGQSGTVTVSFMLYPDGHISDLTLTHASGIDPLNQAALQAVANAAPFANVGRYINTPALYSIHVSFEVNSDE